jgi:AraC-like DNA-binding protein
MYFGGGKYFCLLQNFTVSYTMNLTFSTVAIIIAASQSFLLSLLIFQKHRNIFANNFLAALMLCYAVILVHLLLQDSGTYRIIPLAFLFVGTPLAAMPMHFLYTKYLLKRYTGVLKNDWYHFLPFGIFELFALSSILAGKPFFFSAMTARPSETSFVFEAFNFFLIAQGATYMIISYRMIQQYTVHIKDISSSVEYVQMNWLRNITIAGLVALFLFLTEDLLMLLGVNLSNFILASVSFAVYVYGMGYVGLSKSEILGSPEIEKTMYDISTVVSEEGSLTHISRYEKSGLDDETVRLYDEELLRLMEEKKPFLNPTLTLARLAEMLQVSPHNLSEVINTQEEKNFYDFVNDYRIEQVKKDLVNPAKQHLKILSLALEAGFNSKASFNTIFKEETGMTPSEYRKTVAKINSGER